LQAASSTPATVAAPRAPRVLAFSWSDLILVVVGAAAVALVQKIGLRPARRVRLR
jgi:hypothetical protein